MPEIDQYDFDVPKELIAQFPLKERTDARLLVVDRKSRSIDHWHVRDLHELLTPGDCLVLNNTRVLPARLVGYRTRTKGRWQGLFLEATDDGIWRILCKTRGRLVGGETIQLVDRDARPCLLLHLGAKLENGVWIVRPESTEDPLSILQKFGRVPLPPYIRSGEMVDADRDSYQTVYADPPGSIAAPTAGLHFTEALLKRLETRGVSTCQVTLHVGHDTFRSITTETLSEHQMHSEWGSLSSEASEELRSVRAAGGRVISVGTTSVRVLETAASTGQLGPWQAKTNLFIRPPYEFRAVDALLTNFHLPRTSLVVLVRAFGGDELIRRAYDEAIAERYRFFSYGDAMLVL